MKKENNSPKQKVNLVSTFILLPLGLILLIVLAISYSKDKTNSSFESAKELSVNIEEGARSQPSISSMINGRDKKKVSNCQK